MITATTSDDIFSTDAGAGTYDYVISKGSGLGNAIFSGKAAATWAVPAVIDVGSVIKDYLYVSEPALDLGNIGVGITRHEKALGQFYLYVNESLYNNWTVRQDYSGEPWTGADKELSEPINGHVDPRQIILYSAFLNNATNVTIETL